MNANNSKNFKNRLENAEDNYYSVLGCDQSSTPEELKRNYQVLIRQHHPDKQENKSENYELNEQFIRIDRAYKILRDEKLRQEYNASLLINNLNENSLIYAEISKSELVFNNGIFLYLCRCGDSIKVPKDVLNEPECVVECSECTNCILIK